MTLYAARNICPTPDVSYVVAFQNWLPAVAPPWSICTNSWWALISVGQPLERELAALCRDRALYARRVLEPAARERRILARTRQALLIAVSQTYPTRRVQPQSGRPALAPGCRGPQRHGGFDPRGPGCGRAAGARQ